MHHELFCSLSAFRLALADRTSGARLIRGSAVCMYGCWPVLAMYLVIFMICKTYSEQVVRRSSLLGVNLEREIQEVLEDL